MQPPKLKRRHSRTYLIAPHALQARMQSKWQTITTVISFRLTFPRFLQLMLASYHGHVELTTLLLSLGANPNLLNDRQQSCLSGAIFKNETAIIQLLLDHLADPDLGNPSGAKACEIFGRGDLWNAAFEFAREKIKAKAA